MKCEVVGWLFVESDKPQLLVRDENKDAYPQPMSLDTEFERQAIQTGSFRRGNPIVDPVTRETVGYEMERLASPYVVASYPTDA